MAKIRILPEQLANQIAAGEVVERPASVIKELLENSLDAGATRIDIEVEGGGTRLMRIIDNGEGMDEDDVLLSLERHGTSKILTDEDLAAITTLGFRGEAIPSIGSVAKMIITSRQKHSELGTRAEIHYGKLIKVHEAGCSVGTIFEIRSLFGNTPARRKFLRTVRTELNHIDEVVKNYSLANPSVSFSLAINGRPALTLDSTLGLEKRLAQILHYSGRFITVGDESAGAPARRVYGFLVPPEELPSGPARLRLFVNGRAIKDRMLRHAVIEGLRGFLMKGKNPAGLIHLILPADEVDVNVHPAKHEVRFKNGRDVHLLVSQAITGAMQHEQRRLQAAMFGKQAPATRIPLDNQPGESRAPSLPTKPAQSELASPATQTIKSDTLRPDSFPASEAPPLSETETRLERKSYNERQIQQDHPASRDDNWQSDQPEDRASFTLDTAEPVAGSLPLFHEQASENRLQIIGQLENLYIFCRNSDGLVVIDQHAAHERLLYEEYRQQFLQGTVARQNLLFPETVELSLFQTQLVEKNLEEIDLMGFTLREFGGRSYILSAVPALAGKADPTELFFDVLEQFGSESSQRDGGNRIDTILSTMACKAAVKAGTELSHREIEALLERMAKANLFSHCPHGRPVVKQFSQGDMKKWFRRT